VLISSTKSQTKALSKSTTQQPGILLKGWFKYIVIKPSADSQEFETNPEFDVEARTVSSAEKEQMDEVG